MIKKFILIIFVIFLVIWWLSWLTKLWYIDNYLWISYLETAIKSNDNFKEIIEEKINSLDINLLNEAKIEGENNQLNKIFDDNKWQIEDIYGNESNNTMTDIIAKKDQWNKKENIINNIIIEWKKANTGTDLPWEEDDNINLYKNDELANIEKPDYKTPIFVHEELQEIYNEPDPYDSTISVYEEFLDREYTSNLGDDVLIYGDIDSGHTGNVKEFGFSEGSWINVFNTEKNIKGGESITGLWSLR